MHLDKKLSIIIPYRDRLSHAKELLPKIIDTIKNINYKIIIVEQSFEKKCNPAFLKNIGSTFADDSDYFCFHDVDMIPDLTVDYSYSEGATHLAGKASQYKYKLPYNSYFGGVLLIDRQSFINVNGYCNEYWGWVVEDDDFYHRCLANGIKIKRRNCLFECLNHERDIKNLSTSHKFLDRSKRMKNGHLISGLNNLKFELISKKTFFIFDKIETLLINVNI